MNDYNFGNIDFDIKFGEVTEKDLDKLKKEEAEYYQELKDQAAKKK
jgi:adenylate kinase